MTVPGGSHNTDRDSQTLLSCLFACASRLPARIAIRSETETLDYAQFRSRIVTPAAALRSLGVAYRDRVLICVPNGPDFPVLYFAVHALGAAVVPVPADTPGAVLAALAEDCSPSLAVLARELPAMPCPVCHPSELISLQGAEVEPVCSSGDIADILYTTGTTGKKKGVVLTHANVLAAASNMGQFIGTNAQDVEVMPLPLSHSFGLGRLRSLALVGHTLIVGTGVGVGVSVIRQLIENQATGLALVPAAVEILRRTTGDSLGRAGEHLRYIEIGSAPMRPQTRDWLMRMLPGTRICHHYGLTEASRAAFTEYHADRDRPGTAGRASPGVALTICDESGSALSPGQTGEVVVSGGMVMREYWNQPSLTHEAFCEHGLRTGDIGFLDSDGYLFLLGRKTDLINVGGRKVVPDEVEENLRKVSGIRDAACVGEDDPLTGQRVKAYLVADRPLDVSFVANALRTQLEEYKIPKSLEFVKEMPRTNSGKLQRHLLRATPQSQTNKEP